MAAQVLTIYVGDDDKWQGGLLYPALVERLKDAGIAGVTVLHGVEGFGAHAKLHTARLEVFFSGLPVVIEAVDTPQHIEAGLAVVEGMVQEGLVTIGDVRAVRYTSAKEARPEPESPPS
jgi:PII-like signaling protein